MVAPTPLAEIQTQAEFAAAVTAMNTGLKMDDPARLQIDREWIDGEYMYLPPYGDQVYPHPEEGVVHLVDHPSLPTLRNLKEEIRENRDNFDNQLIRLIYSTARYCAQYSGYNFTGRPITYKAVLGASGWLRATPTILPPPATLTVTYQDWTSDPVPVPADRLLLLWPYTGYTLTGTWPADHHEPSIEEAIILIVGYIYDNQTPATSQRLGGAIVNSGAAIHLNRYKRRWS